VRFRFDGGDAQDERLTGRNCDDLPCLAMDPVLAVVIGGDFDYARLWTHGCRLRSFRGMRH
jgi:hypothetical protein